MLSLMASRYEAQAVNLTRRAHEILGEDDDATNGGRTLQ
jgi:hypothetical protein